MKQSGTKSMKPINEQSYNYKNYSLEHLSEWIEDALASEATPEEIYTTILNTIRKRNEYHQSCLNAGESLLRKMNVAMPPHRPNNIRTGLERDVQKFWEEEDISGSDS